MVRIFVFFISIFVLFTNIPVLYAQHLNISGCSVSYLGYLKALSRDYEKKTGTKIVLRAGGSIMGIEDLRDGRIDIAASCKRPDIHSRDFDHIQVAWDALVVIVHKSNPVNNMSLNDIRGIFSGKIKNFRQIKGNDSEIKVFVSNPKKGLSGVGQSTIDLMLQGKGFSSGPNIVFLASTAIVEQMVENNANGFGVTGYSSAKKRNVKIVSIDGVYPTRENIVNGRYPFKRPLYLVLPKNPVPEARKFIEFALSKEGQGIIRSEGIISLSEMKK